ncbi:MAG TPA: NB-ARC domain-containing protein, partial [Acidimicrobiales bacterium]|nr:NB-ARC domain-containing protein [Acidimicrobiales bacterium]
LLTMSGRGVGGPVDPARASGSALPLRAGPATLLYTDMVESTASWIREPTEMARVLIRLDAILAATVAVHGGWVAKQTGDGIVAVFSSPRKAIEAALAGQQTIGAEDWGSLHVASRMGVHSGDVQFLGDDIFGLAVNVSARIQSAAHGGQILLSKTTEQLASGDLPDGVSLASLGERLLRGVPAPIEVFQLCYGGLRREFPEIRARRAGTVMPAPSTEFLDPRGLVAGVEQALAESPVVTLTGPGGVGKSRLAVEVSRARTESLRWVNLVPVDDPELVLQTVASDLQVNVDDGDLAETVIEFLQHQRTLLVLDNCERHLPAVRTLASSIIHDCPEVKLLATSREPLGLADERLFPVEPLYSPQDPALIDAAVELFVHSAQRSGATLDTGTDGTLLRDICQELDGLPLAIELAAARVATVSLAELRAQLAERFRVLRSTSRERVGEPEHHRSISETLLWSYNLSSEQQQLLLDRLAVFSGGFSADAAAQVCSGRLSGLDVRDALSELARKSLVRADSNRPVTRFSLLETVRAFAHENLARRGEPEGSDLRRAHARYYADLAEAGDRGRGGPEEGAWVALELEELANFRSAVTWAAGAGDAALALRIYVSLYELAAFQGRVEIFDWIEPADFLAAGHELTAAALAMSAIRHGPSKQASVDIAEQAVALQRDNGMRAHRLLPWAKGFAEASRGNPTGAAEAYAQAAQLVRDLEGENGRWITALSLDTQQNLAAAEDLLVEARR